LKRLAIVLLVFAACRTSSTTTTSSGTVAPAPTTGPLSVGGPTARAAVQQFLTAVRAQDLQAMSTVFGTSRGPSRDNMDREQLEKRLIILQCYFNHDKFRILGEVPGEAAHRVITVELTRGRLVKSPRFYVIRGPADRWFVDNMEIAAVAQFCAQQGR
jgi:hypothetical protein